MLVDFEVRRKKGNDFLDFKVKEEWFGIWFSSRVFVKRV